MSSKKVSHLGKIGPLQVECHWVQVLHHQMRVGTLDRAALTTSMTRIEGSCFERIICTSHSSLSFNVGASHQTKDPQLIEETIDLGPFSWIYWLLSLHCPGAQWLCKKDQSVWPSTEASWCWHTRWYNGGLGTGAIWSAVIHQNRRQSNDSYSFTWKCWCRTVFITCIYVDIHVLCLNMWLYNWYMHIDICS